jgi:hypothetical protein
MRYGAAVPERNIPEGDLSDGGIDMGAEFAFLVGTVGWGDVSVREVAICASCYKST